GGDDGNSSGEGVGRMWCMAAVVVFQWRGGSGGSSSGGGAGEKSRRKSFPTAVASGEWWLAGWAAGVRLVVGWGELV
nr:hypothetical protein [Tanacetum cinerariifolium]